MKEYFQKYMVRFISTVSIGMKVTFKHLFVPAVTIQYPDVKLEVTGKRKKQTLC